MSKQELLQILKELYEMVLFDHVIDQFNYYEWEELHPELHTKISKALNETDRD